MYVKSSPAGKKQAVDSQSVAKRLQSELMSLMASAEPGISAFPDGDSLFSWIGTIKGAAGEASEQEVAINSSDVLSEEQI